MKIASIYSLTQMISSDSKIYPEEKEREIDLNIFCTTNSLIE